MLLTVILYVKFQLWVNSWKHWQLSHKFVQIQWLKEKEKQCQKYIIIYHVPSFEYMKKCCWTGSPDAHFIQGNFHSLIIGFNRKGSCLRILLHTECNSSFNLKVAPLNMMSKWWWFLVHLLFSYFLDKKRELMAELCQINQPFWYKHVRVILFLSHKMNQLIWIIKNKSALRYHSWFNSLRFAFQIVMKSLMRRSFKSEHFTKRKWKWNLFIILCVH